MAKKRPRGAKKAKKVSAVRRTRRPRILPTVPELTHDEMYKLVNTRTTKILGITADEFLKRAKADDLPATPEVTYLKILAGVER